MTMMTTSTSIITTMTATAAAAITTIIMTTMPTRYSPAGASRRPANSPRQKWSTPLTELDTGNYGMILRSKGIVDGGADGWLEFDYVPASGKCAAAAQTWAASWWSSAPS